MKWEHNTYLYPVNGAVFSASARLMSPIVMLYLCLGELAKENTPQRVAAPTLFTYLFVLFDAHCTDVFFLNSSKIQAEFSAFYLPAGNCTSSI